MHKVFKKALGDPQAKTLKRMRRRVKDVNALEPKYKKMSDAKLQAQTAELKKRLKKDSIDKLLPDAFAVVREAAFRTLKQRHFDVQLIGGMVLHEGKVAEMKTGEGKTLVATAPVYLNALTGKGVHVVTVNDYLAQRDAGWMAEVYHFLGLTTGVIIPDESFIYDPKFTNKDHADPRMQRIAQQRPFEALRPPRHPARAEQQAALADAREVTTAAEDRRRRGGRRRRRHLRDQPGGERGD